MDLEKMSSNSKGLIDTLTQLSGRRGEPPADPPPPSGIGKALALSSFMLGSGGPWRGSKLPEAVQSSTRKDCTPTAGSARQSFPLACLHWTGLFER
jgi:hypothetical protein